VVEWWAIASRVKHAATIHGNIARFVRHSACAVSPSRLVPTITQEWPFENSYLQEFFVPAAGPR
jgi:hypothetical protein